MSNHHDDATRGASAALQPRATNTESTDDEGRQQHQTIDSENATEISPTAYISLDTDASPLQPKLVAESNPIQRLTELKESANVEEEVFTGDLTMVSADVPGDAGITFDHEPIIGQQMAKLVSNDLTPSVVLSLSGEPRVEEPVPAAANQQASQEHSQTTISTMIEATISSDTETTPKQYLGQVHEMRINTHSHTQQSRLNLPMPHPDWEFDDMLVDLNNQIKSSDELNTMKDKFQSDFRKKAIDEIKLPRDLFRQMKQRQLINANNIIYLQSILMKLKRPDLIERTIDYCQRAGNVLHFKPATETPENGYKYVRMHLYLDKAYTKDDIAQLQFWVAKILCCPSEFVHLVGVEPSNSLLVTIMLPVMYVDILVKYLEHNILHDKFAALDIDIITIDGNVYKIQDCQNPSGSRSEEQLVSLYHQLASKDLQLEGMENALCQLTQRIEVSEAQGVDLDKNIQIKMSEEKHEQLMEKVGMLENKVNTHIILLNESEKKYKQLLEQKMEDLEKQLESSNAVSLEKQNECKHLVDRIKYFEKRDVELITKLERFESENGELLRDLFSKVSQVIKKDEELECYKKKLLHVYTCK